MPTSAQVLARTLPAAALLAGGPPALVHWGVDETGNARTGWITLAPALLMGVALLVQHLVQAPRPRLDAHRDQPALRRWIRIASDSGRLPADPRTRAAAGALACGQLETAALTLAGIVGVIGIWVVRAETWWAVTAVLLMLIAVIPAVRARRSERYLTAVHPDRTTG